MDANKKTIVDEAITQQEAEINVQTETDNSQSTQSLEIASTSAAEEELNPFYYVNKKTIDGAVVDDNQTNTIEIYVHTRKIDDGEDRKVRRERMRFVEKEDVYPLANVFHIKKREDHVGPVESNLLFCADKITNQDLVGIDKTFMRVISGFAELVPGAEREEHYREYDIWQNVPDAMNHVFRTNLLNMDSVRFYESLMTINHNLWPDPQDADNNINKSAIHDILILGPPTGGAATGTIMYLDINKPHLTPNWRVLTKQPWHEENNLDQVLVDDNVLFWEDDKWRFLLPEDMSIDTADKVQKLIKYVNTEFGTSKIDLVVADLSPSLINLGADIVKKESTNDDDSFEEYEEDTFMDGLKHAMLIECGEIETALRLLKDGGHFLISLVNPSDVKTVLGNISFLCGLFSTVDVIIQKSSSTWIRPVTLVCGGYVGLDTFQTKYPDFREKYMSSMAAIINNEQGVMLDFCNFPESVVDALLAMCKHRVAQEGLALAVLVEHYYNKFLPPEGRFYQQVKDSVSRDFVDTLLQFYELNNKPEWRMYKYKNQVCDTEVMELLKTRWETERKISSSQINDTVNYLSMNYSGEEIKDEISEDFKDVPVHSGKSFVKESIPSTIKFSRFASLQPTYDYMLLRSYGYLIPITGLPHDLEAGATCAFHDKEIVVDFLSVLGLDVAKDHLVIECVNYSNFWRATLSDAELQEKTIKTIVSQLQQGKLNMFDDLFVCMLPLTTRILVGAICIMNKCFHKTTLVLSKKKGVVGILFQNFRGGNSMRVQKMKRRLECLLSELQNDEINMEFVSLQSMFNCVNSTHLMLYNDAVFEKSIKALVGFLANIVFFRRIV